MDSTELVPGFHIGGMMTAPPIPNVSCILNLQAEAQYQYQVGALFKASTWMPIPDGEFPGIPWLDAAVDLVVSWRRAGWSILVHCAQGKSRSGMVAIACFMKEEGYGFAKAFEFVVSKRPIVQPNAYFTEGLLVYEQHLNGTRSRIWTPHVINGEASAAAPDRT